MSQDEVKSRVIEYIKDTLESIYYGGEHQFEFKVVGAVAVVKTQIYVYIALIDAQDFASYYDSSEEKIASILTDLFSKDKFTVNNKDVKVSFEIENWDYEEEWLEKTKDGINLRPEIDELM